MGLLGRDSKSIPPSPPPEQNPGRAHAISSSKSGTTIGPQSRVKGTLSGDGPISILGRFDGSIKVGSTVRIERGGEVKAEVEAKKIYVSGKVIGDIRGTEIVELMAGASVEGDIMAPKVIISEGAIFQGSVDMKMSQPKTSGKKDRDDKEATAEENEASQKNQKEKKGGRA